MILRMAPPPMRLVAIQLFGFTRLTSCCRFGPQMPPWEAGAPPGAFGPGPCPGPGPGDPWHWGPGRLQLASTTLSASTVAPKEPWASAALVQLMIEAQPLSHLRYPPPLPCPGPEWGRTPMRQYAHHAQTLRGLRPGHRALPDELCAQRRQCMRDPKWNTRR